MIEKRPLGADRPAVGRLGYGAMVLEDYYGASEDTQAIETIRRAIDTGLDMIDSADAYGTDHNETLVGRAIADRRQRAFAATKFGIEFDKDETGTDSATGWGLSLEINGRPDYVRRALAGSLKRLRVDTINLGYAHYPDPATPIEEAAQAAELRLDLSTLQQIDKLANPGLAAGATLV